jgi:outer membrane receptor protein involved in Fe transport
MSTPNQRILAAAAIGSAAALEEMVITAERREASVLRTPIVITAVTGEQLAEEHLTIIADLQSTVPDLSVTTNGAFAVISIRGIGGSISPASAAGLVCPARSGLRVGLRASWRTQRSGGAQSRHIEGCWSSGLLHSGKPDSNYNLTGE